MSSHSKEHFRHIDPLSLILRDVGRAVHFDENIAN